MYHYTECGLENIYLINGFVCEEIDGEEYVSIEKMNCLHKAIAQALVDAKKILSGKEFRFLRVEMNLSQKHLAEKFGLTEQTIARYEKEETAIPKVTDAVLRSLYMESQEENNPVGFFLELIAENEAKKAAEVIRLEESEDYWKVSA